MTDLKNNNPESPRETLLSDEKHNQFKTDLRAHMLAQGASEESIASAEKFSDLRREFVQEALKIKRENFPNPLIQPGIVGSEEVENYHKQSEETIAEMLLMRKQAQNPTNTNLNKKKPD